MDSPSMTEDLIRPDQASDRLQMKPQADTSFATLFRSTFDSEPNTTGTTNKAKHDKAYSISKLHNLTIRFKQDLSIVILEGKELPPKRKRAKSANPYCKIRLADQKMKTLVVKGSLNPHWGTHGTISVSTENLDKKLEIRVLHKHSVGGHKVLGVGFLALNGLSTADETDTWVTVDAKQSGQSSKVNSELQDSSTGEAPTIDLFMFHTTFQKDCVRAIETSGTEFTLEGRMGAFGNLWTVKKGQQPLVVVKRNIVLSVFEFYEPGPGDDYTEVDKKRIRMMLVPETIGKKMDVILDGVKYGKLYNNKLKTADSGQQLLGRLVPGATPTAPAVLYVTPFEDRFPFILAALILNYTFTSL